MIFIEHSPFNQSSIRDNFGAPDYSYLFIRTAFSDALDQLGQRVDVRDVRGEADAIYHAASERGEDCVFLSYNPPQKTVLGLSCPTIPVFAWEYDSIPYETWNDETRNDWRTVFARTGMGIALSSASAAAVRASMGAGFPIWAIPAPLFEKYQRQAGGARGWREPFDLSVEGGLAVDVGAVDLSRFHPDRAWSECVQALRLLGRAAAAPGREAQKVRLHGVVYTTVLCPADSRKNWRDLVSAFIWAFRSTPSATLLFKLTHANVEDGLMPILRHLSVQGPFECRIILINGLLSDDAYAGLIDATSYAVNTAVAEGQCLPLTEYMSAGRPAVAPSHSAMLDYVHPDNSFVIAAEERPAYWPQDERCAIRTTHHWISFADLVQQYRASYLTARDDPARYAQLSASAVETMRDYCSTEAVVAKLGQVLEHVRQGRTGERRAG